MKPDAEVKKPIANFQKAKDEKGLSTNIVMKAEVFRRLGFDIKDIAERFQIERKDLRAALKKYKPNEEAIRKITDSTIEVISNELKTGFTTEMKAVEDIYYWGINKLRLKVQYDNKLTVRELREVVEFAYKIREGNPLDDTIANFFAMVNNKQEIINMANDKPDDKLGESATGAKESSGTEAH